MHKSPLFMVVDAGDAAACFFIHVPGPAEDRCFVFIVQPAFGSF